jgi:hypothetical protein
LNSHLFYLKSGPQCLGRKEFNTEKETFLITAGVEQPQYKRRKTEKTRRNPITLKRKTEEAAQNRNKTNRGKNIEDEEDTYLFH